MTGPVDASSLTSTSKESVAPKPRVEIQRRTISPYDISSSDNPGSVISHPLLRGLNYNEWTSNVHMALKARKKFGFVDDNILKPHEESGDLEDWWTNNALVMSWLKLMVVDSVHSTLSHLEVASDLWNHIDAGIVFETDNVCSALK